MTSKGCIFPILQGLAHYFLFAVAICVESNLCIKYLHMKYTGWTCIAIWIWPTVNFNGGKTGVACTANNALDRGELFSHEISACLVCG